jgi:hypothetical protein
VTVTRPSVPWLETKPPWEEPAPESLCAEAGLSRDGVPVIRLLSVPSNIPELVALRADRFVPLFGEGPTRSEAVRALANLVLGLGERADVRGADHALALSTHRSIGSKPLEMLAHAVRDGQAPALYAEIAIAYSSLLGASDLQRESIARLFEASPDTSHEARLAITVGGGDYSAWREHYESLRRLPASPATRVARLWFEWVLARRFSALEQLHAISSDTELDPASAWLAESAFFVQGEDQSKERLVSQAERVMAPVAKMIPRVMTACARDLVEGVRTPLSLRWKHLRAGAAKDHAAAAIRHWLAAATAQLEDDEEHSGEALSPEPSRAATEARTAAGEFLLDWFVGDRDAREDVDAYARRIVRVYHRLRGAQTFARALRELAPASPSSVEEQLLWGKGAQG